VVRAQVDRLRPAFAPGRIVGRADDAARRRPAVDDLTDVNRLTADAAAIIVSARLGRCSGFSS